MAPLEEHWVFGVERAGISAREVRNGYELVAGLRGGYDTFGEEFAVLEPSPYSLSE